MNNDDILKNMAGTAFNVLLEQGHPDLQAFEAALRTMSPITSGFSGDLRNVTLEGERIEG